MRTAGKLIKGSIIRNLELSILLGVTFYMTPVIVHSLGNRMYGFWSLVGAFIGYYGLLDFGLSSAASRYISQALGKGDAEELNGVANTAFFLFCLVGLAALAVTLLLVTFCPLFIQDAAEIVLFRKIILLLGIATAISFPLGVYGGILTSYLRYDSMAYIAIARTLISNAAIYHYLGKGSGIMALAVISFIAGLLQYTAIYAVCTTQCPSVRIVFFRFERTKIRMMFSHSWKTFVCGISDIIRFRIDSLLIAGFLNVSLVTPYSIGLRLVDGFGAVVLSSVGMMLPVFSRYEGRGDYDLIRSSLLKVTKLTTILVGFIGFSIIFYAKALILRWMGPGFESSYYVAAILCVALMIEFPQTPGIQVLYGLSKHEVYAALNGCEAVLNVILSVILLKYYGIYGVVLGSAIEIIIVKLFVLPVYICRTIQLSVRVYLVDTILATMLRTAVPLGIYFYLIKEWVTSDYARICVCGVLQTVLFIPTAYFFVLSQGERRFIKEILTSFFVGTFTNKSGEINATA